MGISHLDPPFSFSFLLQIRFLNPNLPSFSLIYRFRLLVTVHEDCFKSRVVRSELFRLICILVLLTFSLGIAWSRIYRGITTRVRLIGIISFRMVIDLIFLVNRSIVVTLSFIKFLILCFNSP